MSGKVLVAYYSSSGNTEHIASIIAEEVSGDIYIIEPKEAYPLSYNDLVNQARKEIQKGFYPELKELELQVDSYDVVFVGTPNWCSSIAPPVGSFLKNNNLAGKTVIPFCTHGGGGMAKIERNVRDLCGGSNVLSGVSISGSGGRSVQETIRTWISKIGR